MIIQLQLLSIAQPDRNNIAHDTWETNSDCFNIDIAEQTDLLPPGAKPGTMPTDYEQATGLERLELLGKMHGIDVFDMRPLDSSRMGV